MDSTIVVCRESQLAGVDQLKRHGMAALPLRGEIESAKVTHGPIEVEVDPREPVPQVDVVRVDDFVPSLRAGSQKPIAAIGVERNEVDIPGSGGAEPEVVALLPGVPPELDVVAVKGPESLRS